VPAISCDHCKHAIETEISKVPGVSAVAVDIETRTVHVDGHASDSALREAIGDTGYDVGGVTV